SVSASKRKRATLSGPPETATTMVRSCQARGGQYSTNREARWVMPRSASLEGKEAKSPAMEGSWAFQKASVGNASHRVSTLLIYRRRVRRTIHCAQVPGD